MIVRERNRERVGCHGNWKGRSLRVPRCSSSAADVPHTHPEEIVEPNLNTKVKLPLRIPPVNSFVAPVNRHQQGITIDHPVMRTLIVGGPVELAEWTEATGYQPLLNFQ